MLLNEITKGDSSEDVQYNHLSVPFQEFESAPNVFKVFDFDTLLQPGLSSRGRRNSLTPKRISNGKETRSAAPRKRIRVATLLWHLAGVSVCLVQGPGFQRRAIDEAINASVVND